MSKNELVFNHRHIAKDMPARAILRKDVELLHDEKVPLRCIDMAYRSLTRLRHLNEGLEAQKDSLDYEAIFSEMTVDSTYQLPCEPWNRSQSLIISVAEIEGGMVPRQTQRKAQVLNLALTLQSKLRQALLNLPQIPWTRKRKWTSG